MPVARFACFLLLCLGSASRLYSTPACISDTLSDYEALGSGGCLVGPQTVQDFSFSVVSSGGGDTPVSAADITVTPTSGPGFYGLQFASPGFTVSGAEFANYLIGYTWDSLPIRGLGGVLDPGSVDVLTDGCVGFAFAGALCSGTPVSTHVFEPSQLTDFVAFSPTSVLGILDNVSLSDSGSCTATPTCFENDAYVVPEPASFLLAGWGLALFAALRRITATNG